MSAQSTVYLLATDASQIGDVLAGLHACLNRPNEPTTSVTVQDDRLGFTSNTWHPLLRVRVEDALDELFGTDWRGLFVW